MGKDVERKEAGEKRERERKLEGKERQWREGLVGVVRACIEKRRNGLGKKK